jgi:hypothetical protein
LTNLANGKFCGLECGSFKVVVIIITLKWVVTFGSMGIGLIPKPHKVYVMPIMHARPGEVTLTEIRHTCVVTGGVGGQACLLVEVAGFLTPVS